MPLYLLVVIFSLIICFNEVCVNVTGNAASTHIVHAGGGSNYLCMPHDPIYGMYTSKSDNHGILYGSEYQTAITSNTNPFSDKNAEKLDNHDVPCAVCRVNRVSKRGLHNNNKSKIIYVIFKLKISFELKIPITLTTFSKFKEKSRILKLQELHYLGSRPMWFPNSNF